MVLFSDGVRDIQKLMACLQRPCSSLSFVDVTETLYCIATLLYAMREKNIAITNRSGMEKCLFQDEATCDVQISARGQFCSVGWGSAVPWCMQFLRNTEDEVRIKNTRSYRKTGKELHWKTNQ